MKIFYMGRRLNGRFDSFKAWLKRLMKRIGVIVVSTAVVVLLILLGGKLDAGNVVYQRVEAESNIPPVLQRIAKCESTTGHFDKNGQVMINATKDMGKYQINVPTWGKKANEMGYNLAVEEDNEAFAVWLYENHGTVPWVSSSNCWNR